MTDVGPLELLRLRGAVARVSGRNFGPFDVSVAAGERIAILGPSGAGKSTLLRVMSGERTIQGGSAWFDERTLAQWSAHALATRRAVLPQSHAVAFGMPAELVVSLGRIAWGSDAQTERQQLEIVSKALQATCAGHLIGRRFDTLSGGEQARVQLARVLAQLWDARGGLLLVDEPLAALDPGLQFELMDAMRDFTAARDHALVAVLHDLNQALAGFERLWLVRDGRLVADLPADHSAVPFLERLFCIRLRCIDSDNSRVAVLAYRAAPTAGDAALAD